VTDALHALLSGAVDYAGLFPPAKLPLDEAIRNYARYRREAEAWMLGRFVIPAARLAELAPYDEELFSRGPPFAFSTLGRGGGTLKEFLDGLQADLRDVAAFRQRHGERVRVDVLEVRLPADFADPRTPDSIQVLNLAAGRTAASAGLQLFCEAPGEARDLLEQLTRLRASRENTGFKLRCGGLEPSAFPSPAQVADVLEGCCGAGVPLKLTAGLHHPLRHFDASLRTHMHGFINLYVAAALAYQRQSRQQSVSAAEIRRVVEDEDAANFSFNRGSGLSWRGEEVECRAIADARRRLITSFGSCSFDEPRDDLRTLGWLVEGRHESDD
jgi:hypothetical protein